MSTTWLSILLGSTVLVSLITLIKDLLLWRANRKAILSDRISDKIDKVAALEVKVGGLESTVSSHTELLNKILKSVEDFENFYRSEKDKQDNINRTIIADRLRIKCSQLLKKDSITYNERKELLEMWNIFHDELNGDGNFNDVMVDIMNMKVDMEN